jgi:hypothetical protein
MVSQRAGNQGTVRDITRFVGVATLTILVVALILGGLVFTTSDGRRAVMVSAWTAWAVQLAGFAVVWRLKRWNVMGAWGLAMLLRFLTLAVYALVAVKVLQLPVAPALFSLVTFFFVTTLAEPWLLRS